MPGVRDGKRGAGRAGQKWHDCKSATAVLEPLSILPVVADTQTYIDGELAQYLR